MPVASDKGGGSFQLAPIGNHLAICVRVVDLGTQKDSYLGKPKIQRKVVLGFELVEEKAVFDESRGEESFLVSREYTLSLGEKANLRHDLESWRGRAFTEEELKGFDLKKLLGAPCMVNVVHEMSKQKRQYSKIKSITTLPKKMKKTDVPKPTLDLINYDIEDVTGGDFSKLPKYLQDKIAASCEASGEVPEKSSNQGPDDDNVAADSDLPF